MATLHIVNHPSAIADCLEVAGQNDTILLIEEGVRAATQAHGRDLVALSEDLASREINVLAAGVETTDYPGFVDLVATHQPIVSWNRSGSKTD